MLFLWCIEAIIPDVEWYSISYQYTSDARTCSCYHLCWLSHCFSSHTTTPHTVTNTDIHYICKESGKRSCIRSRLEIPTDTKEDSWQYSSYISYDLYFLLQQWSIAWHNSCTETHTVVHRNTYYVECYIPFSKGETLGVVYCLYESLLQ